MTPEEWLSTQIKEKGVKQSFISRSTGIQAQKLSASLTGRRRIKTVEFIAVCMAIGVNPLDCPIPQPKGEAHA